VAFPSQTKWPKEACIVDIAAFGPSACSHKSDLSSLQVGKAARTTVVCTQGKPTVRDNIQAVYGTKVVSTLEAIGAESKGFRLQGFVSSAVKNANKGNSDRQFLYINGRPVDLPKAVRTINECYKYEPSRFAPLQTCANRLEIA
jgi:DNA mismatch repair protein PMS2